LSAIRAGIGGNGGADSGTGEVPGVFSRDGFLVNVIDEGLEGTDDDGSESRVPPGEPSGVKLAGRSVVEVRLRNCPVEFRKRGRCSRLKAKAASYG
jgi:hypothetical protein